MNISTKSARLGNAFILEKEEDDEEKCEKEKLSINSDSVIVYISDSIFIQVQAQHKRTELH